MARRRKSNSRAWRLRYHRLFRTTKHTRKDRRRFARIRRSKNGWMNLNSLTFTKIALLDAERLWLQIHAPRAHLSRVLAEGYQHTSSYKKGTWDGYVEMVTFDLGDVDIAISFKNNWWNYKCH